MARRKKAKSKKLKVESLLAIVRQVWPHQILNELSKEYKKYMNKSRSEAEYDYWLKCARSTANLGSGMEKWLNERIDEEEGNE